MESTEKANEISVKKRFSVRKAIPWVFVVLALAAVPMAYHYGQMNVLSRIKYIPDNAYYTVKTNVVITFCRHLSGFCSVVNVHNVVLDKSGANYTAYAISNPTGIPGNPAPMKYIALTNNGTLPAQTEVLSAQCGTNSGAEKTASGLARVAGTFVIGTFASGTGHWNVTNTFTFSATDTVQATCLMQDVGIGSPDYRFAEATFTSVTGNNLDTLLIKWKISLTY